MWTKRREEEKEKNLKWNEEIAIELGLRIYWIKMTWDETRDTRVTSRAGCWCLGDDQTETEGNREVAVAIRSPAIRRMNWTASYVLWQKFNFFFSLILFAMSPHHDHGQWLLHSQIGKRSMVLRHSKNEKKTIVWCMWWRKDCSVADGGEIRFSRPFLGNLAFAANKDQLLIRDCTIVHYWTKCTQQMNRHEMWNKKNVLLIGRCCCCCRMVAVNNGVLMFDSFDPFQELHGCAFSARARAPAKWIRNFRSKLFSPKWQQSTAKWQSIGAYAGQSRVDQIHNKIKCEW